ncbi:hypothetical protein B0H14DRAFT_2584960 [Mycena olivaceomarginata]|nr:hypothetical protein B0H14DRAFT_2584960 [Mycena olivaceomarginata]
MSRTFEVRSSIMDYKSIYLRHLLAPTPLKNLVAQFPIVDYKPASLLPTEKPTQAPCSLLPAHLTASQIIIYNSVGEEDQATTDIFGNLPDHMGDYFPNICLQGLTALLQNTFQSLYHLVRMELGVIMENQIYSSPVMFNHTISDVYLPPVSVLGPSMDVYCANESRSSTTNATLMSEWENTVRLFNDSDNLPVINYFRIVPHLKSLGAAITSVFVLTFAMLSTLWTVFSLVAGALAPLHEGSHGPNHGGSEDKTAIMEEWDMSKDSLILPKKNTNAPRSTFLQSLRRDVDTNMAQTQLSLAHIELLLKKHGLLEEKDVDHGMGLSHHSTATPSPQEKDSLLGCHPCCYGHGRRKTGRGVVEVLADGTARSTARP